MNTNEPKERSPFPPTREMVLAAVCKEFELDAALANQLKQGRTIYTGFDSRSVKVCLSDNTLEVRTNDECRFVLKFTFMFTMVSFETSTDIDSHNRYVDFLVELNKLRESADPMMQLFVRLCRHMGYPPVGFSAGTLV